MLWKEEKHCYQKEIERLKSENNSLKSAKDKNLHEVEKLSKELKEVKSNNAELNKTIEISRNKEKNLSNEINNLKSKINIKLLYNLKT